MPIRTRRVIPPRWGERMSAVWSQWDGRCLAWRAAGDAQLHIDGVRFAPVAASAQAEFDVSPSGNAELEFCLCAADGTRVAPPWRVRHGHAAPAGVDQWQGPMAPLRPL